MNSAKSIADADSMKQALAEVRSSRLLINRLDEWLFDEIKPDLGRRIIEIGCGHGNFTEFFLSCDNDLVFTTDIDPESVDNVLRRYGTDTRLTAKVHNVCDPVSVEIRDARADTVFSLNVLEHIEDDRLALANIAGMLVPGGKAIIIVPAHDWAYGTMDKSIGHYRRYTKKSIRERMQEAGFGVERQSYMNLLGLLGWFVNARILRKQIPPNGQLRLFNKLVPAIRTFERALPPPAGISVLTVATRL